jgi:hypothetical protein
LKKCIPATFSGLDVADADFADDVEDDVLAGERVQFPEDLLLQLHLLVHDFNVEVEALQVFHFGRALDPSNGSALVLRGDLSLLHALAQELVDALQCPVHKPVLDIAHDDTVSRLGGPLRYAASHCACPHNPDRFDCHDLPSFVIFLVFSLSREFFLTLPSPLRA